MHAKALRIRAFWSEIGRTPGCAACETPGPGKSHTRECKTCQDAWEEYIPEIRVHSNSGGGDVAAKMKMVICGSSNADPTKTKVIERVVRYTNILGAPISYLPNEDG